MILVDTSIWIDHFHVGDPILSGLIAERRVVMHPFVIGEVAVGSMRNRSIVITMLSELPRAVAADDEDVLRFIADHELSGIGLAYVDVHLLAACRIGGTVRLWTRDRRLRGVAERLGVAADVERPH